MSKTKTRVTRSAFTLIELLVVIAIIAILMSLLLPVLGRAKESATRVVCAAQMRQCTMAVLMYAAENDGRVIPGSRILGYPQEHLIWLSDTNRNHFLEYLTDPELLTCPKLYPRLPCRSWANPDWYLGFNYIAGHPVLMATWGWPSARTTMDDPGLAMFAELNEWSPADRWSIVPHPRGRTPIIFSGGGLTPEQLDCEGGNVARLDGAVGWYRVEQMQTHYTYSGSQNYRGIWPDHP